MGLGWHAKVMLKSQRHINFSVTMGDILLSRISHILVKGFTNCGLVKSDPSFPGVMTLISPPRDMKDM